MLLDETAGSTTAIAHSAGLPVAGAKTIEEMIGVNTTTIAAGRARNGEGRQGRRAILVTGTESTTGGRTIAAATARTEGSTTTAVGITMITAAEGTVRTGGTTTTRTTTGGVVPGEGVTTTTTPTAGGARTRTTTRTASWKTT